MSVGEHEIDRQHKTLIAQINKLMDILSSLDVDMNSLREAIHFLKNTLPMKKGIWRSTKDFQKELKIKMSSGNFSSMDIKELLEKIRKYMLDWLIHHIKGTDQEYANISKEAEWRLKELKKREKEE